MYRLGLFAPDWETVHYPKEMKAVGNFTAAAFDPLAWKANCPDPAFVQMTPLDGYWGAKRVMSFRDDRICAIVEEGRFQDPKAVDYITRALESRRDAIGRAWFRQVLPLEGFRIVDGRLTLDDLAVQYGFSSPSRYHLSWFVWHNEVQKKKTPPRRKTLCCQIRSSLSPPDRTLVAGSLLRMQTRDRSPSTSATRETRGSSSASREQQSEQQNAGRS
jgi:hypothetical protein